MSVPQAIKWTGDRIGDGLRAVGDAAGDVIKATGDAIVKAVDYGADVVRAIAKDPLPTLLSYAGMAVGIPPYITSAVITAARGGNLEDIAKSAAVSYATTSFMSNTQIGADIQNYTTNAWAGDFTDSMVQNFNLPLDTAMQVYKVASSTLNSSLTGGINAALTGKSVAEGISSGFASGLVYSGTNSYFDSVNKDPSWGFSPKALEVMKGATTTALNTAILGKGDPAEAVGNYLAYASLNMAGSELWNKTKSTYNTFTEKTKNLKTSSDNFTELQTEYERLLNKSENRREEIIKDTAEYQKILDEKYTPFKTNYDNLITKYGKAVDDYNSIKGSYAYEIDTYNNNTIIDASTRASVLAGIREKETITLPKYAAEANALADQVAKLYADNKPILDSLEAKSAAINNNVEEFNSIKYEIEAPDIQVETPNLAQKLKDASDKYQVNYETWAAAQSEADKSAETYTKALAEVATRDATIDAINSGAITATKQDDDGNWVLSNGMTLTKDGNFVQDGVQQFTNAVGIDQRPLDFTRMGDEQTAALRKGQVTSLDAAPTRYVPIQSVDANNKNVIAASDALSAAVARDGTPKNTTFSPVYYMGEDGYRSYVTSSDIDGKPTGYTMTYYPDTGVIYSWGGGDGEQTVDANGNPVLSTVYINSSRKPPKFDSATGAFVDSSGQRVQAPAQTPPESIPTDVVAEKPVDPTIKNPFENLDAATLMAIYGNGTSLVKNDVTGEQSIVKTSGDATVGSKVDLTVDAKTGETTAVVKTPDAITPVAPSAGTPAGNVSGTPAETVTETTPPVDSVNTTAGETTGATGSNVDTTSTNTATTGAASEGTSTAGAGSKATTGSQTTIGSTTGAAAGTQDLMSQFNSRVDQLIGSGKTSGEAVSIAYQEINLGLSDIQKNAFEQEKAEAEKVIAEKAAADKAAKDKAAADKLALKIYTNRSSANASNAAQQKAAGQGALSLLQPASSSDLASVAGPLAAGYLMAKEDPNKFESPLDKFLKLQNQSFGKENQYGTQVQGTPMNDPSYSYGTQRPIGDILNMGSSQSTQASQAPDASTQNYSANLPYAKGGRAGTRHGKYATGGLSTPLMASGGKMRVDFRHGDAVTGAGDGQSDDIPAMLADGEFVFPADVVAAIGNGSTKAGSDKLYDMMHGIRAHARSAKPKDLPPQIKSPLDFLKRTA